jgi:phosphoribosylamine---glycine ligase
VRVAVIGGGGREHALAAALAASPQVERVFAVPGNPGTSAVAANVGGIDPLDGRALAAWAGSERIDLVVVGPEAPLVAGVADVLAAEGHRVFGPTAAAATIEGSKSFAKQVMAAAGVPTARAGVFTDPATAVKALDDFGPPWVVKADGLAAGKGVTVTSDPAVARAAVEASLVDRVHGAAGAEILLEEYLPGPEASLFAVSDGHAVVPLAPARDYKRVGDGDRGPNTGGMGAHSPLPDLADGDVELIRTAVLEPVVAELARRGTPYRGLLYAGLVLTADGPKVLEFNCRFGDPETQALLPRLRGDLAGLLAAAAGGDLAEASVRWDPRACVTVVLASGGYPGPYRSGLPVTGLEAAAANGAHVYHAGTALDADGHVVTAGGRVLAVSALGDGLAAARDLAYEAAALVRFDGAHHRRDIAADAG